MECVVEVPAMIGPLALDLRYAPARPAPVADGRRAPLRILFLASRFPFPPERGDRVLAFNFLQALASRGHCITLVTFETGAEPAEGRTALAAMCARVETVRLSTRRSWAQAFGGLLSAVPSQVTYYRSSRMRDCVARVAEDGHYDAVLVQMVRMAPYASGLEHECKILFLTDSMALNLRRHSAFAAWWKRPGLEWERWRVARYEPRAAGSFHEAWVVSRADHEDLAERGCANLRTVPVGVDVRLFDVRPEPTDEPRLLFVGNFSVPHNVDAAWFAAHEVLPRVRERIPATQLWLAGADPVPRVRGLARLPGVIVTGRVPDLLPIWSRAAALLAPLRFSTGVQNKVLQAMAAGVPVVTTPPVAGGMAIRDGELARVAADPAGLAEAACKMILEPESVAAMVARARNHVRRNFTSQALAERLEMAVVAARGRP